MGTTTNGQICFGILFEEGYEFPWDEDGLDIDDWWREVKEWRPSKAVYTEGGNRLPGVTDADIDAYYRERREWDKANPCPVALVNYCSGDCPMYILAIPSTMKSARRGYPEVISRDLDFEFKPGDRQAFLGFMQAYEIDCPSVPAWYLSSYWG